MEQSYYANCRACTRKPFTLAHPATNFFRAQPPVEPRHKLSIPLAAINFSLSLLSINPHPCSYWQLENLNKVAPPHSIRNKPMGSGHTAPSASQLNVTVQLMFAGLVLLCCGSLAAAAAAASSEGALSDEDLKTKEKIDAEYKRSGFQWMTPLQYHNMDKVNNTKPYLFQFLSSRCWLCLGLLEHMATKEDQTWISNLSSQFNAVMIWDSQGWQYVTPTYTPEGMNYVPHTIFAHPNGTMRTDLKSRNAGPKNPAYYLPRELLWEMVHVIKQHYNATEAFRADLDADL